MHDLRRWGETGGDAGKAGYLLVKVDMHGGHRPGYQEAAGGWKERAGGARI